MESIILFDGKCCLCNGLINFIANRDRARRFRLAWLQSDTGQALLRLHRLPSDSLDTFYVVDADNVYARSDGALFVASRLPWPWPILRVLWLIPRRIRDFLYGLVARNRYALFGKTGSCTLPAPEVLRRFVE